MPKSAPIMSTACCFRIIRLVGTSWLLRASHLFHDGTIHVHRIIEHSLHQHVFLFSPVNSVIDWKSAQTTLPTTYTPSDIRVWRATSHRPPSVRKSKENLQCFEAMAVESEALVFSERRGFPLYARTWSRAREALESPRLVAVAGVDPTGGARFGWVGTFGTLDALFVCIGQFPCWPEGVHPKCHRNALPTLA